MFSRDRWTEIWESVRNNKLRTFLSGFTITLGILIFTVLFGFGNGLKNSFQEFFVDDATNTIWISPGLTTKPYRGYAINRRIILRNDDLHDLQKLFGNRLIWMTPRISTSGRATYRTEFNNYSIRGVAPAHRLSEKTIIMKGRYIHERDIAQKTKNIVIGRLVEKDLFGKKSALGKTLDIDNINYTVIGVFQDDGGDNEERYIYMPYTTRQLVTGGKDELDQIILGFDMAIGFVGAKALTTDVEDYLRTKHLIHPDDDNALYIDNAAEDVKETQQFASILQLVVTFVGLGTLLAGIIGISNIMIFVVKERTKELGIRKALGASPMSVIGMILQESTVITLVAGYIGILIGMGVLSLVGDSLEDYFIKNPQVDLSTVIWATLVLVLSGVLAGFVPARRAARIKPIVALRDE